MFGSAFNLKEQLTFYGSYHNNPTNQIIHFIFVPLLLWTGAVWLAYTPPLCHCDLSTALSFLPPTLLHFTQYLVFNGAFVLYAFYSLYYIALDPLAGLTWTLFNALPGWGLANFVRHAVPAAWQWALGLHIFSWFVQVHVGHTIAEKRKPALMDSFFQSLFLAPLFVWFELLFVLGYRRGLYEEVQARVKVEIETWKRSTQPLIEKKEDSGDGAGDDDGD